MGSDIIPISNNKVWKDYQAIKKYLSALASKEKSKCTHNDAMRELIKNSPDLLKSATAYCNQVDTITQEYIK